MKKKSKILVSLFAVLSMVMLLTACGGKSKAGQADSDNSKKIEFWNFFTGPDGDNMKKMIDGFNKTNPKYKVNNVTMNGGDMYQKIPTVVNSGKGVPDLCIVDVARIPMFKNQDLLEPLDNLMKEVPDINENNYRSEVWKTGNIDGTQYSIPLDMGVTGLIYNKKLVEKYAPNVLDDQVVTVDELKEIIPKAKKDGIATLPASFFSYEMATSLAKQKGADLFESDGVTPNLNSPQMIEAFSTLRDIQKAGGGIEDGDDALQMFINNQSVFCQDGVWDYNSLKKAKDLDWGITNTLAYSPEKVVNVSNSNQFVLLKSDARSKEKEKVIADFLNYVRDNTLEWAHSGQIPASKSADDESDFKEMPGYFFVSSPEVESSIIFRSYKYGGIADDAIYASQTKAIYGEMSVKDMLNQAQKQTEDNIAQQK